MRGNTAQPTGTGFNLRGQSTLARHDQEGFEEPTALSEDFHRVKKSARG
jgi:hypothetical protein